ncbi:MAG: hypothetical protein MMC23_002680 [Stictis urceolatum]|nr:hypothetical protein [Stictis urceolata]
MAEEPQQRQSIQDRIAALNVGHVRAPITATPNKRPVPKPPIERSHTANVPTTTQDGEIGNLPASPLPSEKKVLAPPEGIIRTGQVNGSRGKAPPPPRVPPRTSTGSRPSPALPARRPSEQLSRRDSQESICSTISTLSNFSTGTTTTSNSTRAPSIDSGRIRAPVYDPATLPPLAPKRSQQEKDSSRPLFKGRQSSVSTIGGDVKSPSLPPSLPQRKAIDAKSEQPPQQPPQQPMRKLPPTIIPPVSSRSLPPPLSSTRPVPRPNGLPTPETTPEPTPPPIPSSTRPDLSKLMATKPKFPTASTAVSPVPQTRSSASSCLICRDFSAVDSHAARFPRQQVPSLAWLASSLCDPFPSHTDKARAIFTWCHHNISYNTHDFFNKCVKPSTPASTLETGLAVCEGYASLYAALATKAGLGCIVVGGHGKGYGHSPLQPGQACPPPDPSGHAWNAVKIDNGEWKLTDPCWGAGAVNGKDEPYRAIFTPAEFTKSNDDFGLKHYPSNRAHFFRNDGRPSISWEEYFLGPNPGISPPRAYCTCGKEGFNEAKLLPRSGQVSTNPAMHDSPTVRFQLERVCPHWDPKRNGKGMDFVYCLELRTPKLDLVPFETNGRFFWADVAVERLGQKGGKVQIVAITTVNGMEGRGLSVEEFRAKQGRTSMSWDYVAGWELV